jgi:two-component system NarL family sensor kinase
MAGLGQRLTRAIWPTRVLVLTTVALLAAGVAGWLTSPDPSAQARSAQPFSLLAASVFTALGALIVPRRPGNLVGWLFQVTGAVAAVAFAAAGWSRVPVLAWFGQWTPWLAYGMFPLPLLLFPDGRLPSRRWRAVVVAGVAGVVVPAAALAVAALDQPTSLLTEVGTALSPRTRVALGIAAIGVGLTAAALVAALAALVLRWRTGSGERREQLKWLLVGAVVSVVALALETAATPGAWVVAAVAVPVASTVAILRHHLWDVDLFLRRSVVYAVLTAFVVVAYALLVNLLGAIFADWRGYSRSVVATAAVAAAFHPIQIRVQRLVDRLLFGDRADPYAAVTRVSRSLEDSAARSTEPAALLRGIAGAVAEALQLPYVALQVDGPTGLALTAEHGRRLSRVVPIPMTYQGHPVGRLLISPRTVDEDLTPAERRLLADLARQAGLATHSVLLSVELQRSRERLVRAREEERRRLRRDLHDGVGAALAGLRMQVSTAPYLLDAGDEQAVRALFRRLEEELGRYAGEVRRLIEGMTPAALDQLGLPGALRRMAAAFERGTPPLQVEIVAVDVPERPGQLPAAVEIAAYRIATEAITNAARHAGATRCRVRLAISGGELVVEVTDDGPGLASEAQVRQAGVGLSSMRERATEIGGVCLIEFPPRAGVRVFARLPVAEGTGVVP